MAGTIFDSATIGVLAGLELEMPGGPPGLTTPLIRAVVFLKISAIAFQFLIFMRTDIYALFVQATGCKHLWVTKGAIARTAIRRSTSEDVALLASAGRREIFWGPGYFFASMRPACCSRRGTSWCSPFPR